MCRSIYDILYLGELKKNGLTIQLANKSNAYSDRVLKDLLVQVNQLICPARLFVLDMSDVYNDIATLLSKPFLKTSRIKLDMHKGTQTMEFDGWSYSVQYFWFHETSF